MTAPETDGAWHAANSVINGTGSYIAVDGATTIGSVTTGSATGPTTVQGATSTTCDEVEAIFWDNYAMTAAEAAALNASQHAYWGF